MSFQQYTLKGFKIMKYNVGKPFYLNEEKFKDPEIEEMNEQFQERI